MTEELVLAVDGGGSKTDLAVARADGALLELVRGPISSPQVLGFNRSLEALEALYDRASMNEDFPPGPRPVLDVAEILLSGRDYPAEEERYLELASGRGWAKRTLVGNDTFAVLRAGSEDSWGVAVVCGTGINCVGVSPNGRRVRFPALGELSGDWGGGYDLGLAALAAAVRSEDGRGPKSSLEDGAPALLERKRPLELVEAIHTGKIQLERVSELAPLVLAEAETDPVAGAIVDRLAAEVVAFARSALVRLELAEEPVEVVLGGAVLQAGNPRLLEGIEAGLLEIGPRIGARVNEAPPVAGAALLALDELGASTEAKERLRAEIVEAAGRL